ncbi:MAG: hypothetical protein M3336_12625, partial [Chloroflexota bacterium]|nr:hypothetical protein [Chloroflexota bacterium]
MTITTPSVAPRAADAATTRQFIRYIFFKLRPTWRLLPQDERAAARSELLAVLEPFVQRLAVLRAYSTLGTRAD